MFRLISIILACVFCLSLCEGSSAQVYDIRKGKFPSRSSVSIPVKTDKIFSKCENIYISSMILDFGYHGSSQLTLWGTDGLGEDLVSILDLENTKITITGNKVAFEYDDEPDKLSIIYLGKHEGMKKYEISGCDSDGIEFKRIIEGNPHNKGGDSPIHFYVPVRRRHNNPGLGYEKMDGDEPVLLELVKKWASKFKVAKVYNYETR